MPRLACKISRSASSAQRKGKLENWLEEGLRRPSPPREGVGVTSVGHDAADRLLYTPPPNSTTRNRTPTVKAIVRDNQTSPVKSNVKLYVDGRRGTNFSYIPATDRLSYTTRTLAYGRHTAKIVARDAAGNVVTKQWSFRVTR